MASRRRPGTDFRAKLALVESATYEAPSLTKLAERRPKEPSAEFFNSIRDFCTSALDRSTLDARGLGWVSAGDTAARHGYTTGMPVPHSRHVALTEPLARFVDGQVATGRYATASEVVRAALRLLMEREDALTQAAEQAGPPHE